MGAAKYSISRMVYASGNSRVYEGADAESGTLVVLKTSAAPIISPQSLARLKKEHRLLGLLDSSYVPRSLGFITQNDTPYLVLEYCQGISLAQRLRSGRLTLEEFFPIAVQMAQGLCDLHRAGIIHKDINPANALWDAASGRLHIIDLNLASEFSHEKVYESGLADMEGSIYYIAPEQTGRMNATVDFRADFYSLGASFYEMLCGCPPFFSESVMDIVFSHMAKVPADVRDLAPEVPSTLAALIHKLLAKMPKDRYSSAEGLFHDLTRCAELWSAGTGEAFFELGQADFIRQFELSRKIFGREAELRQLKADYQEVLLGARVLVALGGAAGVGKTSLAQELQEAVFYGGGLFLSGKFDQYHRDVPYYAFFQAFEQWCSHVLSEPEASAEQWCEKLRLALGTNACLLTTKVAGLALLLGEQPAPHGLSPREERARFRMALQSLLTVLASEEHPLALFLDDVHLADLSSLELLVEIQRNTALTHLLSIVSYRDNEVDANHPLTHSLDKIMRSKSKCTSIVLTGLCLEHAALMIADSLKTSPDAVQDMAQTVYAKTDGNPFYIKQFLHHCHRKGHIYFDLEQRLWQWREEGVRMCPASSNVVDFLIQNMGQVEEYTAFLLGCAACIGQSFDVQTLTALAGLSEQGGQGQQDELYILEALKPVVDMQILCPTTHKTENGIHAQFQFAHDRFQQAFYTALPDQRRTRLHYALGRLYDSEEGSAESQDHRLHCIADNYAKALSLASGDAERAHMEEALLAAARSATRMAAFDTAARYLELLLERGQTDMAQRRDFVLAVHIEYHAALYALVRTEEADSVYEALCRMIQHPLERVDSCCLQMASLANRGQYKEAFFLGATVLGELGVSFNEERLAETLQEELDCFYVEWAALGPDNIAVKGVADDALELAINKLLNRCVAPGLFYNPLCAFWTVIWAARRIFRHGYTPDGLQTYSNLMVPLLSLRGDFKTAYLGSKAAMALAEKHKYREVLYNIYHLFALHTCHWFEDLTHCISYARESIEGNVQVGDFQYACFAYFTVLTGVMETSSSLEELDSDVVSAISFADKTGNQHSLGTFYSFRQFCRSMRGDLTADGCFDGPDFSEQEHTALFAQNTMALCYFFVLRAFSALVFRDYATAYHICRLSAPMLPYISGFYPIALHNVLYSLSICKVLEEGAGGGAADLSPKKLLGLLKENQSWLRQRMLDAPDNFAHLYHLVEAEIQALRPTGLRMLSLYEKALNLSKNRTGLLHRALITETVSQRYSKMGIHSVAESYLKESCQLYDSWGAQGKVAQLKELYPHILEQHLAPVFSQMGMNQSYSWRTMSIDLDSVMKAAQAISVEIRLDRILEKLIHVLLENAGAQDIYLLSRKDEDYEIQAEGHAGDTDTLILPQRTAVVSDVAFSVVQYVERSRETVILDHALSSPLFGKDPHIRQREGKSLLCMPILGKGDIKGILYLENNLATGVFDQRRKDILVPIAAQLAISLENAYLYDHMRYLVDERTKELRQEISIREQAEEDLARMANHDPLTGLPNRRLFQDILSRCISNAEDAQASLAVLFVDLDGFKAVNDTHGHEKGDLVLTTVAERLLSSVRGGDTVSRMGGDEFVLIIDQINSRDELRHVCQRVLTSVGADIELEPGVRVRTTPSIGVSQYPQDGVEAESLIASADKAMYFAKKNQKNQFVFAS